MCSGHFTKYGIVTDYGSTLHHIRKTKEENSTQLFDFIGERILARCLVLGTAGDTGG
jgi:primosomal protein N''